MNFERNENDTDAFTPLAVLQRWPARAWRSTLQRALVQAEALHRLAARSSGALTVLVSSPQLADFLGRRRALSLAAGVAGESPRLPVAAFLGVEGAHCLQHVAENLDLLFAAGVRMLGLAHFFDNEVGGSAHGVERYGLTPFGVDVVARCERMGISVDLAHASPSLISDVLLVARKPVVVSHTGVRGTCDNSRNLSDDQLRAIAKGGGVACIAYFDQAVCGNDVGAVIRALLYSISIMGSKHVCLGSDWDGAVVTPFDAAGLRNVTEGLLAAGVAAEAVEDVMGGNLIRVLLANLPPADHAANK